MIKENYLKQKSIPEFEKVLERCKDTAQASLEDLEVLGPRLIEAVPKLFDLPKRDSVKLTGVKVVRLDDVYCPPMNDNPMRSEGKDQKKVDQLKSALKLGGLKLHYKPLIVERRSQIRDGTHYEYVCHDGNHRYEVFESLGIEYVIVAVYDLCQNNRSYSESVLSLQANCNDHSHCLPNSVTDLVNGITKAISEGSTMIDKNDKDSIVQWVEDHCPNMDENSRAKVIAGVIRRTGNFQNVVTYTKTDNEKWIKQYTDYTIAGKYDKKRDSCGWGVQEGYEPEQIMNAVMKYFNEGYSSYFLCRTNAPSEQRPLNKRRKDILTKFDKLGEAILSIAEYYEKNDKKFPWYVEGFLPQDHKANEKEFIPTRLIKK